jgi:phosphomannomutase
MARTNAVFGTEHSAHYYFREFWGADNGMLAALHVVAELLEDPRPMSQLAAELTPYFQSGEINFRVGDVAAARQAVVQVLQSDEIDRLDGLTISSSGELTDWWWVNVRPSNTEPLLRLNVEAAKRETMERIRHLAAGVLANAV